MKSVAQPVEEHSNRIDIGFALCGLAEKDLGRREIAGAGVRIPTHFRKTVGDAEDNLRKKPGLGDDIANFKHPDLK